MTRFYIFMFSGAIRVSAPTQVAALVFVVLGFSLGVVGGIKQNATVIAAAVMYIFSGKTFSFFHYYMCSNT